MVLAGLTAKTIVAIYYNLLHQNPVISDSKRHFNPEHRKANLEQSMLMFFNNLLELINTYLFLAYSDAVFNVRDDLFVF